jgi:hypothetical protein
LETESIHSAGTRTGGQTHDETGRPLTIVNEKTMKERRRRRRKEIEFMMMEEKRRERKER